MIEIGIAAIGPFLAIPFIIGALAAQVFVVVAIGYAYVKAFEYFTGRLPRFLG